MVNPINQNALLDLAMKAWDATKQPLKQRGPFPAESLGELPENPLLAVGMGLTSIPRLVNAVAPVGIYEDGSYGPAWPGVMAVPAEGMANFGRYGYDSPEAVEDNARSAFDVAGGAMTGSLATGLAGGMVDNAVGSAATKAAHDVSKLPASAAFKFNGEVFPGRYHAHGISAAAGRFGNKPVVDAWNPQTGYGDAEGFLTMDGAFVSRKDATDAIRASGLLGPYDYVPDELHAASLNDLRDRGLWANAKPGAAVPLATQAAESQAPKGITAYHGSPHDFDRFDLSKIGTGEGAQAYGHGLYFAESEDVAKSYRDQLASTSIPENIRAALQTVGNLGFDSPEKALRRARNFPDWVKRYGFGIDKTGDQNELNALRIIDSYVNSPPGRMYEVNIKANPEDFLDWDKPLSQQSEAAINALKGLADGSGMYGVRAIGNKFAVDTPDGSIVGFNTREEALAHMQAEQAQALALNPEETAGEVVRRLNKSQGLSKALLKQGIPGIRYLDQMSRAAGQGSNNYVVFDDSLIDILRKYANAPTGAAVPLGMDSQSQDLDPALLDVLRQYGMMN